MLRAKDGNFYGTTVRGGTNGGFGTIFRMATDGILTTLFSFNGTNGSEPMSALIAALDGGLYGTTLTGGLGFDGSFHTGYGTVFKLTFAGELITLHRFAGDPDDGARPAFGGLTSGTDGNFYDTTDGGGVNASGTIFRITPDGSFKLLYSFSRPDFSTWTNLDGCLPSAGLILAVDGNFYGVTTGGGLFGRGAIFRLIISADPPVIEIGQQSGNLLRLAWNAVVGRQYQLQCIASVDSTNWEDSGLPITATNAVATASVAIGPERQWFYRVVVLP
jgi:uncharacterized repeat protein (TIGR03803 family)